MLPQISNGFRRTEAGSWKPDERVLFELRETGFTHFHLQDFNFRTDTVVLSAIINSYSVDDKCFFLGGSKLVPTLDDVARIMGLPIDGKPITGQDFDRTNCFKACEEYLGSGEFIHDTYKATIDTRKLKQLESVPDDAQNLDIYVRAHVLHYIGTYLMPYPVFGAMPSMFLDIVKDVRDIKNFAWGAAFLAHTMDTVDSCKKKIDSGKTRVDVYICSVFLLVFLYEYMPSIVPMVYKNFVAPSNLAKKRKQFPLLVGWSKALAKFSLDSHRALQQNTIVRALQEERIKWQPFKNLRADFLPNHLKLQMHMAYCHTIVICFEKRFYHEPHICPKKLGLDYGDVKPIKTFDPIPARCRRGPKWEWSIILQGDVELWGRRKEHYITENMRDYARGVAGMSMASSTSPVESGGDDGPQGNSVENLITLMEEGPVEEGEDDLSDNLGDVAENAADNATEAEDLQAPVEICARRKAKDPDKVYTRRKTKGPSSFLFFSCPDKVYTRKKTKGPEPSMP